MDKLQNDGETDTKKNQEITEFRRIETSKSENIKVRDTKCGNI